MRLWILHQSSWRVIFKHLAMRQDQHFITLDDRVESVSDRDHSTFGELLLDQLLDLLFCHDIDVCSGLIKDHNSILSQDSPADTNELLLSRAQIGTCLADLEVNTLGFLFVLLAGPFGRVQLMRGRQT